MKKSILKVWAFVLIATFMFSCDSEQSLDVEDAQENARVENVTFENVPKNSNRVNGDVSVEEFLEYVYFDGEKSVEFMENNGVDKESFLIYISEKVLTIESYEAATQSQRQGNDEEPPSLEEIRDAMINECQNGYCCMLDEACEIAVKIAYHLKKSEE